jgi:hypothetical protein
MPVVDRSTIRGLELFESPPEPHLTNPDNWVMVQCACSTWEVHIYYPIRRCGKCRQHPEVRE